jgi:putative tryptophan/tyrosine transport system ATP-binding protein
LLDEHTAALDPKTAKKVLEITEQIVVQNNLTTFMVTHNMKHAISMGNRLIMMNEGRIVYDVCGEEKKKLEVSDLLKKFEAVSHGSFANDRMMLESE